MLTKTNLSETEVEGKNLILNGEIIPEEMEYRLMREFINEKTSEYKGLIFDGFPRNQIDYDELRDIIPHPDYVINKFNRDR